MVRERDPVCAVCRRRPSTDAMHFISRRYRMVRWDPDNARGGCRECHTRLTRRPREWILIWSKWLGERRAEALKNRSLSFGYLDLDAISLEIIGIRELILAGDPSGEWKSEES